MLLPSPYLNQAAKTDFKTVRAEYGELSVRVDELERDLGSKSNELALVLDANRQLQDDHAEQQELRDELNASFSQPHRSGKRGSRREAGGEDKSPPLLLRSNHKRFCGRHGGSASVGVTAVTSTMESSSIAKVRSGDPPLLPPLHGFLQPQQVHPHAPHNYCVTLCMGVGSYRFILEVPCS